MRFVLTVCAALVSANALAQAPAPAPSRPSASDQPAVRAATPAAYDEIVAKARTLLKANKAPAALIASQEAIALDDKRWEAYVTAAGAYSSQSLYDDAVGMLQAALTRAPEDRKPSIRDALAETRRALSSTPPRAAAPAAALAASAPTQAEIVLWKSIENSRNAADFQGYLDAYPSGAYAPLAKRHLSELADGPKELNGTVSASTLPVAAPAVRDCNDCPQLVIIPRGRFAMGSPMSEAGHSATEDPVHDVSVGILAIGKFEVTRGQFAAFVAATNHDGGNECFTFEDGKGGKRGGRNWRQPGFQQTDQDPVVCVSWDDASAYVRWLSSTTGKQYRLPSEAEWEYAARAGTTTSHYWGDNPSDACAYANVMDRTGKVMMQGFTWQIHNCDDRHAYTAPVGSYRPNAFGLHDMLGNAFEWTEDCWHPDYRGAPGNGTAWLSGEECTMRVYRGGSWFSEPENVRAANRSATDRAKRFWNRGFRVARTAS